jgi:hypothetical protein
MMPRGLLSRWAIPGAFVMLGGYGALIAGEAYVRQVQASRVDARMHAARSIG